jgi:hypothetical protein
MNADKKVFAASRKRKLKSDRINRINRIYRPSAQGRLAAGEKKI